MKLLFTTIILFFLTTAIAQTPNYQQVEFKLQLNQTETCLTNSFEFAAQPQDFRLSLTNCTEAVRWRLTDEIGNSIVNSGTSTVGHIVDYKILLALEAGGSMYPGALVLVQSLHLTESQNWEMGKDGRIMIYKEGDQEGKLCLAAAEKGTVRTLPCNVGPEDSDPEGYQIWNVMVL